VARALELATRALARRDFSERGLRERLVRAGVEEAEADEALRELTHAGLVDDGRFALVRAEALAERGKGNQAIRFDLERQGVGSQEIELALAGLEPERERLERIVRRRGPSAATARLLAGRGFDEEAIGDAVAQEPPGALGYEGSI
jgi:SOS response regulatory protein OraA/RecX